eukprot:scaffold1220_cov259-Pinguiococcus_pyrenoidosus.AAC.120
MAYYGEEKETAPEDRLDWIVEHLRETHEIAESLVQVIPTGILPTVTGAFTNDASSSSSFKCCTHPVAASISFRHETEDIHTGDSFTQRHHHDNQGAGAKAFPETFFGRDQKDDAKRKELREEGAEPKLVVSPQVTSFAPRSGLRRSTTTSSFLFLSLLGRLRRVLSYELRGAGGHQQHRAVHISVGDRGDGRGVRYPEALDMSHPKPVVQHGVLPIAHRAGATPVGVWVHVLRHPRAEVWIRIWNLRVRRARPDLPLQEVAHRLAAHQRPR